MPAVFGPMQFIDTAHAFQKVRATGSLTEITLRHPDAVVPFQGDVRAGTTYGSGDYTGTLSVIGAASMDTPFSGSTVLPHHIPGPGFDEGFDSGFGA